MSIFKKFLQPIPFKANPHSFGLTEAIESSTRMLDVMPNDTGAGKTLWSITDGNAASGTNSALGATVSIVAGKIAYDSSGLGDLDYLAAGQTITDTITYTIRSGAGTASSPHVFSSATATITITGTNDQPTFALTGNDNELTGDVVEDSGNGKLTDTGVINFTDVDVKDTHKVKVEADDDNPLGGKLVATVQSNASSAEGTVTWTYSVNNSATQYLAKDQSVTESFKVTIDDGKGGKTTEVVTVTVTGTNDAPTIATTCSTDVTGAVVEDDLAQASTSGKIVFKDVDLTDIHTVTSELTKAGVNIARRYGVKVPRRLTG